MVKPYTEVKESSIITRTFSEQTSENELVWHRDYHDRDVKVLSGQGWKIQFENKLPVTFDTGSQYFIPRGRWHRLHKGNTDLVIEIKE